MKRGFKPTFDEDFATDGRKVRRRSDDFLPMNPYKNKRPLLMIEKPGRLIKQRKVRK